MGCHEQSMGVLTNEGEIHPLPMAHNRRVAKLKTARAGDKTHNPRAYITVFATRECTVWGRQIGGGCTGACGGTD
jgi:hypothetical protein